MGFVNYTEFLKQPDVEQNFNSMFNSQREYYKKKCSMDGFDKGHSELLSIKLANISTDLYFTNIHNKKETSETFPK